MFRAAAQEPAAAQDYTIKSIVDTTMSRPDNGKKFYPSSAAMDRNTVVFNQGAQCAGYPAPDSIWAADRATLQLRKLADTATAIPGGSGTFGSVDSLIAARPRARSPEYSRSTSACPRDFRRETSL
jgi:Tfp pilus assembly protein PilX